MAENSNLKSFKAADSQRPTVSSPAKKGSDEPVPQAGVSLGYEKIEKLLEAEDPQGVLSGLQGSLAKLKQLESDGKNQKEKTASKKAQLAYEHTLSIIEYLFKTKEALLTSTSEKK
jgi:hypothetical protein